MEEIKAYQQQTAKLKATMERDALKYANSDQTLLIESLKERTSKAELEREDWASKCFEWMFKVEHLEEDLKQLRIDVTSLRQENNRRQETITLERQTRRQCEEQLVKTKQMEKQFWRKRIHLIEWRNITSVVEHFSSHVQWNVREYRTEDLKSRTADNALALLNKAEGTESAKKGGHGWGGWFGRSKKKDEKSDNSRTNLPSLTTSSCLGVHRVLDLSELTKGRTLEKVSFLPTMDGFRMSYVECTDVGYVDVEPVVLVARYVGNADATRMDQVDNRQRDEMVFCWVACLLEKKNGCKPSLGTLRLARLLKKYIMYRN
eukprot:g1418.t1